MKWPMKLSGERTVLFPNNCCYEMQLYTEERKSTSTLSLIPDAQMGKCKAFRGQEEISVT